MAVYAIWFLGILLCVLAAVFLYKNVVALKATFDAQKAFRKIHSDAVLASSDMGWVWFDVLLCILSVSFSTQATIINGTDVFSPESLCFIGIAVFCAGKAVSRLNGNRMMFYKQGLMYKTEEIPFSSIKSLTPYGGQFELAGKKEKYMISRRQAKVLEQKLTAWKDDRRNRRK